MAAQRSLAQRSLAMTIALRVALATALVCVVVFCLVYAGLAHRNREALLHTIDTDVAGLVDIYGAQGVQGLADRLRERQDLAPTASEKPLYIVIGKDGTALAGNAKDWPNLRADLSENGEVTIGGQRQLVRVTQLRGGLKLLVGRSLARSDASLGDVRLLFLAGLVLIVLSAFFIGNLAASRMRRRIDTLNSVFDALYDGNFLARADVAAKSPDEIDQLGAHVNQSVERVERLMAAQRDVSDNIAHEVRTPLMVLNQKLDQALDGSRDPAVVASLEGAQEQVRAVLRLLDALLDIASAEARRGDLRDLGEVDLSELARGLADLYTPAAEEAGVTLTSHIADGVIVRADAMQMSRLMVNLLDNALKYGAAGKSIRFTVAAGPVITVEDDGYGIADTDKARIFDRYQRAASVAVKGHGLGLALAASLAGRHNLVIRVEDTHPDAVMKGARFVVSEGDRTPEAKG